MKAKAVTGTTGLSIVISGIASASGLCGFAPLSGAVARCLRRHIVRERGGLSPYLSGTAALPLAIALWGAHRSRKSCTADAGKRRYLAWLNVSLVIGVLLLGLAVFAYPLEAILVSRLS